jgi:hypothetical protein
MEYQLHAAESTSNSTKPPLHLLDEVRAATRLRHYSLRTEQAHVFSLENLSCSLGNAIRLEWVTEVGEFPQNPQNLALNKGVAASTKKA